MSEPTRAWHRVDKLEPGTKQCTKCERVKSYEAFSPHKLGVGGVRSICKPCSSTLALAYRKTEQGEATYRRALRTHRKTPGHARNKVKWQRSEQAAHPEKSMWLRARARAKRRGLPFDLAPKDIVIPERCPILGVRLVVGTKGFRQGGSVGGNDDSPSLDRIRPELGYVRGNVAVISWRANRLKGTGTLADLKKLVAWLESVGG